MDFSPITDSLIIGTTPEPEDYDRLRALGVRLAINMRAERPPLPDPHTPSLPTLWLRTHDFPLLPIPLRALRRGAQAALDTFAQDGKVYAYCAAGVHRSPAMGAAILIAQGQSAEDAIRLIKRQRPIADPDVWYIRWRIKRFAANWNNHG